MACEGWKKSSRAEADLEYKMGICSKAPVVRLLQDDQLTHHRAVSSRRQDFDTKKEIDKVDQAPSIKDLSQLCDDLAIICRPRDYSQFPGFYDATSAAKAQV